MSPCNWLLDIAFICIFAVPVVQCLVYRDNHFFGSLTYLLVFAYVPGGVDEGGAADVDPAGVGITAVVQQSHSGFQGAADRG